MSNAIFPALPGLTWKGSKSPTWSTIVQRATGGTELRGSYWQYPIWEYTLVYDFLRQYNAYTEFATLVGFFNARRGAWDSFLYEDPSDYTIADTVPYMQFGTGDASAVAFQLGRSLGGFFEPIYNVHGTPKVYVNNVLKTAVTDYTLSASGLVTFTAPPAMSAVIAWSGSYYWRCRFKQDVTEFNEFANLFWTARSVEFVTVKGS